jgi:hypothetical protein
MTRPSIAGQAWQWLERELERWSSDGRRALFWWRDDDASRAENRLDRLLKLADKHALPLAIAAIPARLDDSLAGRLRDTRAISILQHGYAHDNFALPGQRSLELGGSRTVEEVAADLQRGFEIMGTAFGERYAAVLVPPWNRIDERLMPRLAGIGFRGISTHKARRAAHPARGLLQVNTHLDPVDWRHADGFIGTYPAIAVLVQHLVARRAGYRDADEPSGILSHHLAMNEATWKFLDQLLHFLNQHPAVEFVGANQIWN